MSGGVIALLALGALAGLIIAAWAKLRGRRAVARSAVRPSVLRDLDSEAPGFVGSTRANTPVPDAVAPYFTGPGPVAATRTVGVSQTMEAGALAPWAAIVEAAVEEGVNRETAGTQASRFRRWVRKGCTGRTPKGFAVPNGISKVVGV